MSDVTCVGILVADVVGKPIDRLPDRGKLALVERMELHSGGCAANTGVGLGKLGISTAIVGKIGNDGFGAFLSGECEKAGLDVNGLIRDPHEASSATMVVVHADGERSFLHYPGANAVFRYEDIDKEKVFKSRVVHVAGTFLMPQFDGEPTARLLREAKEAGVTTCLDTCWDARGRWMELIRPCLPYMDYFLPSFEEARMIAGGQDSPEEVARILNEAGVGVVGLKLGAQGSYFRTKEGEELRFPVLPVNATDALGAGDAFVAGFLAGLVQDWDLCACARFATAVGACCVTKMGATTGIKSFDETVAFLESFPRFTKTSPDA